MSKKENCTTSGCDGHIDVVDIDHDGNGPVAIYACSTCGGPPETRCGVCKEIIGTNEGTPWLFPTYAPAAAPNNVNDVLLCDTCDTEYENKVYPSDTLPEEGSMIDESEIPQDWTLLHSTYDVAEKTYSGLSFWTTEHGFVILSIVGVGGSTSYRVEKSGLEFYMDICQPSPLELYPAVQTNFPHEYPGFLEVVAMDMVKSAVLDGSSDVTAYECQFAELYPKMITGFSLSCTEDRKHALQAEVEDRFGDEAPNIEEFLDQYGQMVLTGYAKVITESVIEPCRLEDL